ncbi:MAG: hypothetical protein F6K58_20920 [Symploca sp. SIO2E9]|nr:hypothetical protein [Symploca sp. SIO2E9]
MVHQNRPPSPAEGRRQEAGGRRMSEKRRGEIIKQTRRRPDAQTRRIQIPRKISFTRGRRQNIHPPISHLPEPSPHPSLSENENYLGQR